MLTPIATPPRVLVAGMGNIFLGDDAFGVEVAARLSKMQLPGAVRVLDAGTRTVHLAYELRERAYDRVILIDVVSKGGAPGTLYVLEPLNDNGIAAPGAADGHAVHPHDVVAVVRQLGGDVPRLSIVACEPSRIGPDAGLTRAVESALDEAVELVLRLIASTTAGVAERA
jgi:hydrogenase maturation protease